jgi:hypothetical protein
MLLERLPVLPDTTRLRRIDLVVVGDGIRQRGEKFGKVVDHLLRAGHVFRRDFRVRLRVRNERAAGLLAEPVDKPGVVSGFVKRQDAVERISAPEASSESSDVGGWHHL